ncbi:MAG: Permease of the drug/metabolite transporter (DMT) superfamily [Firmicutes bacterium]|nr:Permease of the drug/metabolite transporter (DMT) superfamily [Bacillota bacterium]MDI6706868.1 DMT family transporter [Bacillota bacterium]
MDSRFRGIIFMIGSSLGFSLMSAAAKYTSAVPLGEKLFVRNFAAFVLVLLLILKDRETLKGNNIKMLTARAVVGFLAGLCYFYAVNYLPLGDATLLNKTSPILVIILSTLFLGEKLKKHHLPVVILGLAGAALVLKPGFQYNLVPAVLALVSALLAGISYTIIRHLRTTDSPNIILLYYSGISVLGTIPMIFLGGFSIPTATEMAGLLFMGLFTAMSQLCLNFAYRYAGAGDLSVFDYSTIIFSIILGLVAWGETPDVFSLAGSILIIAAGIVNYRFNREAEGPSVVGSS